MKKEKNIKDKKLQSQKFIDKAKELKTDENPDAFEKIFDKIISAPKFLKRKKIKNRNKKAVLSTRLSFKILTNFKEVYL